MTHPLPSGWQEKKIGEIFSFIKNYSNSRAELNDYDDISYIHYGDIHKYYRHRIECDKVDFPKISAEKLSKDINNISYVENGDLIVVDASEDYEGTCISAEIKNLNYKLVSGLHTFLLRDKNKIFADGYRGYILYNHDVHIQCCKVATGISVYGVSQENLKNIKIMIPPLEEQKRIAEVLSLCDDVIENLTELIEKKEQYKKGVMQRLLSGEVRFKGFTDEWKTIKLHNKGIEFANIERKMADKRPFYIRKKDEIIIGKQNYFNGSIAIVNEEFDNTICSNAIMSFKVNNSCNNKFIYSLLSRESYMKKYYHLANGTGQKELSENDFFNFTLSVPSLEEQKKIAGLLSVIDEEIENLKKQLELRKQQKKGLMQRLLTGKVRI